MLRKLLKHEFIATGRLFLPVYALLAILTPLLGFFISIIGLDGIPMGLSVFSYILLLIGVFASSFVFIAIRFYRTMTTNEAYLSFTLPAKTSSLILSKLIPALVWNLVSTILVLLSIAGFTWIIGIWAFSDLKPLWNWILRSLPTLCSSVQLQGLLFLTATSIFIGSIAGTLQIYAAIALGQTMRTHRLLFSFIYYMVLYAMIQLLSTIFSLPLLAQGINPSFNTPEDCIRFYNNSFLLAIGVNILFGVGCYLVTVIFFKKKLNLE